MIKQAFLFDSLIKDIDIYKNIANTQKSYIGQLNVFKEIRENPYSWCGYDSFANMLVKH